MRLSFTRPVSDPQKDRMRAALTPAPAVSAGRRGSLPHWHESTLDLQRGLEVIEHFGTDGVPHADAR